MLNRLTLAAALLCCVPGLACADGLFPPPDAFSVTQVGGVPGATLRTGFPEKTFVLVQLELDGGKVDPSTRRCMVGKGGVVRLGLGPYSRPMLPGTYTVRATVTPRKQDIGLDAFFRRFKEEKIEERYRWDYRPTEEAAARSEFKKKVKTLVAGLQAYVAHDLEVGDEYRSGERFRKGGKFDADAFMAWANGMSEKLEAFKKEADTLYETGVLAPYWPSTKFDVTNIAFTARIISIDYTIHVILRRENLPISKRFKPTELMMKPSRKDAIKLVARLVREVGRTLDEEKIDLVNLLPTGDALPTGFQPLQPLDAKMSELVKSNPGSNEDLSDASVGALGRRVGLAVYKDELRSYAVLSLAPKVSGADKPQTVDCVLLRFGREVHAEALIEQVKKMRSLGAFKGLALRHQLTVAVILGPKKPKPTHKEAMRALARHLEQNAEMKELK